MFSRITRNGLCTGEGIARYSASDRSATAQRVYFGFHLGCRYLLCQASPTATQTANENISIGKRRSKHTSRIAGFRKFILHFETALAIEVDRVELSQFRELFFV